MAPKKTKKMPESPFEMGLLDAENLNAQPEITEQSEAEYATPDRRFVDVYPNTELATDLKILTFKPGRMELNEALKGLLTRDNESHFTFMQQAESGTGCKKRNPLIWSGLALNIHVNAKGELQPNLRRPSFRNQKEFMDFCLMAAQELSLVADVIERGHFSESAINALKDD